jgi:hypothetical protein
MFDQQTIDDKRDEKNDTEQREPQTGGSVLREEQAAASQQPWQRNAYSKHAETRFKTQPLDGPLAPNAAARSMDAYAPVSGYPV